MDSFDLFTPYQNPDMCLWFYLLSIIGFVFLVFSLITGFWFGIYKKKDSSFFVGVILLSLGYFIFYFQNRLLYSMCSKVMR